MNTTPISKLQEQITMLSEWHRRFDRITTTLAAGEQPHAEDAHDDTERASLEVADAIQSLGLAISNLPAQTLKDAAIQASYGLELCDRIDCFKLPDDDAHLVSALRRILCSVVGALGRSEGIDLETLYDGSIGNICQKRGPKGVTELEDAA